jgi:membrane-associated phospholipid phosphatase
MTTGSRRCPRRAAAAILLFATSAPAAGAQGQPTATRDTTHAETQAPFFTFKDAVLAGAFAGGTVIMFPLDRQLAKHLTNPGAEANNFFKHASTGVEYIASPGAYIIGGSLYIVGRVGGFDRIADLGWHGTEAVLFGQGVTDILKGFVGRARPFVSGDTEPTHFAFGRGFRNSDWTSFPSGHATTAFAAAAAVTNETTRWWPRSVWIVGPVMYAGATAVGLSRMYHSKHWASDVVVGAAIGTFSGRKVVRYMHGHPGNLLDRIMLGTSLTPDVGGRTRLTVTLPVP